MQGNNGFLIANDEDQAGDDLDLIKKIADVKLRAVLSARSKGGVRRKDGVSNLEFCRRVMSPVCTASKATSSASTKSMVTRTMICSRP